MEPEQPSSTEEESLSSDVPSPDLQGTKVLLVEVEEGKEVSHKAQGGEKMCYGVNKKQQCCIEGNLFPFCVGLGEDPCIHGEARNGGLAHIGVSQVLTFEEASQNGPVELLPMGCCDTTRVLSTSKCDLIAFTPAPQDWEKSQEGFHCVSALQYEDVTRVVCQQQLGYPAVSEEEQFGSPNVPGQMVAEHSEASGQMVEDQLGQAEVLGEEVSGQMVLGQPEALGKVEEGQCLSSSTSQELGGECGEGSSTGELQRRSSDSAVPLNRSRLPTPRTQLKKCSTFSRSVSHLSLMILNAFVILSSFLPSLPPFLPPFLPPCLPPSLPPPPPPSLPPPPPSPLHPSLPPSVPSPRSPSPATGLTPTMPTHLTVYT